MSLYHLKNNIKSVLFVIGLMIIAGILFYTDSLVQELKIKSREFLKFKIEVLEESINNDPGGEVTFVFENVISNADFPIIYSDSENNVMYWKNIKGIKSTELDQLTEVEKNLLEKMIFSMDDINNPIPIRFQEIVLGYYHFGDSEVITKLQRLPLIEILLVTIFFGIGYAGFHSIKKGEKNLIWVGMAKETAHQLGTPLSSLMGWYELIKTEGGVAEDVTSEIGRDIDRLIKISERFSQIGSKSVLKKQNINLILEETISYFEKRLPNLKKLIEFKIIGETEIFIGLNRTLFEWSLENIIKNAIDAIEDKKGQIVIGLKTEKGNLLIDISDNGKGIDYKNRKKIFEAGFSTKKRGWGLGLSLAKRIIEQYHFGKIFLLSTKLNQGSTIRIQLPIH